MTDIPNLITRWREQAKEYDRRELEAQERLEFIVAAQQGGLATAFRVCANELEASLVFDQNVELRLSKRD